MPNDKLKSVILTLFFTLGVYTSAINLFKLKGFSVYGFRVLLVALVAYFIYVGFKEKKLLNFNKLERLFLLFVGSYVVLGVFYLPVITSKGFFVKEMFYWAIALCILFVTFKFRAFFENKVELKDLIYRVHLYLLAIIFVFVLFEMITAYHFGMQVRFTDRLFKNDPNRIIYSPFFTFINPNNLAFYTLTTTSLILLFYRDKSFASRLFMFCSAALLLGITESRLNIISLGLLTIILVLPYLSKIKKDIVVIGSVVGVLVVSVFTTGIKQLEPSEEILEYHRVKDSVENALLGELELDSLMQDSLVNPDKSANIRVGIVKNSFNAMKESNYLGLGPGQFKSKLVSEELEYDVEGIQSPHGFLWKIVANYGIPGLTLLLFLVVGWLSILIKQFKFTLELLYHLTFIAILFINSFGPSEFLMQAYVWTTIGLYVLLYGITTSQQKNTQ
ncbi:O-antigen ligase family protein [Paracrocinitomix mangrovi]|uniref:O-antigen ligase family protein n=1 Tax=Paracrocinitomix mangrovi TaxID=2862509 RepID=UPI001C8D8763|nr:O-antigen ligase family protein [Paracrocinitomix mangrovi]UKN03306.1 O-antigen ligase family protein [Paracrocinitomix mangrovi]